MIRIDFIKGYELARRGGIVGSPEKPLSDLGKKSFLSYWKTTIGYIISQQKSLSLKSLIELSGLNEEDVLYTLNHSGWVSNLNDGDLVSIPSSLINTNPYESLFDPNCLNKS